MPGERECSAFHEAGHAVAALHFRIPIIGVVLDALDGDTPHFHRGRYRCDDLFAGARNLATLCFAGPAAERFFCGAIIDGSELNDYAMAHAYMEKGLAGGPVGGELGLARDAAGRLVASRWGRVRVRRIASALLERGALDAAQVIELRDARRLGSNSRETKPSR
jgi:hypothetical protein